MRRWTLVRHCQAADGSDPGLNGVGQAQAERLRTRLAAESFAAAWSSPQRRAMRTAEIILSAHPETPLAVDEGLCEIDYLTGGPYQEEELLSELWRRTGAWLAGREAEEDLLVVAHGGPLRLLLCRFLALPPERHWSFRLDHAGITVLEQVPGLVTLSLLNDCCHLRGMR